MPNIGEPESSLSDIEFIRQKVLDGDWITVTGAINALNDTIEYVPATGKTFFVYSAKIVMTGHPLPAQAVDAPSGLPSNRTATNAVESDLKIDGVVKDTTNLGTTTNAGQNDHNNSTGGGTGTTNSDFGDGKFNCAGCFLVGDSVKAVEIENVLDNGSATATLIGWIEAT